MLISGHNTRPLNAASPGIRALLLIAFAVLLCPAGLSTARAQAPAGEYEVKAAFLFHFAQLVDWPTGTYAAADQPVNLCILEDEPQAEQMRSTVDGKTIQGRAFHVRLLSDPRKPGGCQILFLSAHEAYRQAAILQALRGTPVLTVGETGSFLGEGGIIRFRLEQDRIRFDVDLDSAESARLKISSQLLLLASSVVHGGTGHGR